MTVPSTPATTRPLSYDRVTIALHWAVALGVALQWTGGHTIDWFPKGPLKIDARSVHILTGSTIAGLVLFRLYWRAMRGERLPPAQTGALNWLAKGLHWGLYLNLVGLLGLGLFLAWLRGDSLFGLTHVPLFGDYAPKARHLLANRVTDWHSLAATLILILAGLHTAAALLHHYYWKDGVLRRMWPR
jgi:cytochrome b561